MFTLAINTQQIVQVLIIAFYMNNQIVKNVSKDIL